MKDKLSALISKEQACYPSRLDDIVVWTRARLTRNLSGMAFPAKASPELLESIEALLKAVIEKAYEGEYEHYINFATAPMLLAKAMVERKIVGEEYFERTNPRGIALSQDLSSVMMINGIDHLQIHHKVAGFDPEKVWQIVDEKDDKISEHLEYAFDGEFGYLSSSPGMLGTGFVIDMLIHLPALVIVEHIKKAESAMAKLGVAPRSQYYENSSSRNGHMFVYRTLQTIGVSESEIIAKVARTVPILLAYEQKARQALKSLKRVSAFEDLLSRSLGLLTHAKQLKKREALDNLSYLRLGAALDMLPHGLGNILFETMYDLQPAHIQLRKGRDMDKEEIAMERAKLVRERVQAALSESK